MEQAAAVAVLDSTFTHSPVLLNHHPKTIDIGLDGSTVSLGPTGDILQLSCYHPKHGIVVVNPFGQFDGAHFHDPSYVREYRAKLLNLVRSGNKGFGLAVQGIPADVKIDFVSNQWVLFTYTIGAFRIATTTWVTPRGELIQSMKAKCISDRAQRFRYSLALDMSVNRASYGQLTEGGPIPLPVSHNILTLSEDGARFIVSNPNLPAAVVGSLYCNDQTVRLDKGLSGTDCENEPIKASYRAEFDVKPEDTCNLVSVFLLRPDSTQVMDLNLGAFALTIPPCLRGNWKLPNNDASMIIKRNLEYILGNASIPVGNDQSTICLIADHVALPLGWNRDNYWQVRYILDLNRSLDRLAYPETASEYSLQIKKTVRGHLKWVFCAAQRPHGYWHRSYLTTGVPKDGPVFQQDQQCYPILELCDFLDSFPGEIGFVRALLDNGGVASILEMFKSRRDHRTGLYPTEETPGDDAVEYPFHFSTHILLWHTLTRLQETVARLGNIATLSLSELSSLALQTHNSTMKYFIGENPKTGKAMFAYLTDGNGQHTFYHDANDIPTLFADDWGFIQNNEERGLWMRTMEFGLSADNTEGYYPQGTFGGLGSVHTRGPWPLGYAQEYVYACVTGNRAAKEDAWRRIKGSMFWDGLFSEAVNPDNGECTSKAWFSWPGAMIGSALLRFDIGEQTSKALM